MKKHFRYGLFFALGAMLALGFVACGDDSSSGPSKNEETGIETEVSSSSENDEAISSSSAKDEVSSSSKKVESSSSTKAEVSSSSTKNKESSSSGKVETSSSKKSSSSSSTPRKDNKSSSSSVKNPEPGEGSSSSESSSSGIVTQNSSSSSENLGPIENSSSSEESSSSVIETSSSSLVATGVCKTMIEDNCIYGTLYDDRDGKTYKTVKIGEQWWMAENLRYVDSTQSVCYANNPDNCQIYGRLYDRNGALKDCPEGWRLPLEKDWIDLRNFAKKNSTNKYIGQLFRADTLWDVNGIGLGYNAFGFSALPAGVNDDDGWWGLNKHSLFWMDSSYKNGTMDCYVFTWIRYNEKNDSDMRIGKTDRLCEQNPDSYFSVRCIKN